MQANTIETISGKTQVFKNGEYICSVTYRIDLKQPSPDSMYEMTGVITIQESERMSVPVVNAMNSGEVFTMQFEKPMTKINKVDMNFVVHRDGQPWNGRYRITNAAT